MTAREVRRVGSVRDIPPACLCDWQMTFAFARARARRLRPDGWELAAASPSCRFHGDPRPLPAPARPRRPAEETRRLALAAPVPAGDGGAPLTAFELSALGDAAAGWRMPFDAGLAFAEQAIEEELREGAR